MFKMHENALVSWRFFLVLVAFELFSASRSSSMPCGRLVLLYSALEIRGPGGPGALSAQQTRRAKQDRIGLSSLSGARAMDLIHEAQEISMIEELLGSSTQLLSCSRSPVGLQKTCGSAPRSLGGSAYTSTRLFRMSQIGTWESPWAAVRSGRPCPASADGQPFRPHGACATPHIILQEISLK